MFEMIKNAVLSRIPIEPGNKKGKLVNISQPLWAGSIAGSATSTIYEYKDREGLQSVSVPVATWAYNSGAKVGDTIEIYNDNEKIRIDIIRPWRKVFGLGLIHRFESTHKELDSQRFGR